MVLHSVPSASFSSCTSDIPMCSLRCILPLFFLSLFLLRTWRSTSLVPTTTAQSFSFLDFLLGPTRPGWRRFVGAWSDESDVSDFISSLSSVPPTKQSLKTVGKKLVSDDSDHSLWNRGPKISEIGHVSAHTDLAHRWIHMESLAKHRAPICGVLTTLRRNHRAHRIPDRFPSQHPELSSTPAYTGNQQSATAVSHCMFCCRAHRVWTQDLTPLWLLLLWCIYFTVIYIYSLCFFEINIDIKRSIDISIVQYIRYITLYYIELTYYIISYT